MEESISVNQNIIVENRKRISVSGARDVISFDDETILLDTALGKMTIKGEGLHIESFNTESGDLCATGKVYAVVYMTDARMSGGFLSRIFR